MATSRVPLPWAPDASDEKRPGSWSLVVDYGLLALDMAVSDRLRSEYMVIVL